VFASLSGGGWKKSRGREKRAEAKKVLCACGRGASVTTVEKSRI